MGETLSRCLGSLIQQINDDFEILVIDDGSDDNSIEILEQISDKVSQVRFISLPQDNNRKLGKTRAISVRESKGKFVMTQIDADNIYGPHIIDFINVFEQINDKLKKDIFLKGNGINVFPKRLIEEEVEYRNLDVGGEDRDLWRRLFAAGKIIWIKNKPFSAEIGYGKSFSDLIRRDLIIKTSEFQTGITMKSMIKWSLSEQHHILNKRRAWPVEFVKRVYDLFTLPVTYKKAKKRTQYSTPGPYNQRGKLERAIVKNRKTLPEVENEYEIEIDYSSLSPFSKEIFYINSN